MTTTAGTSSTVGTTPTTVGTTPTTRSTTPKHTTSKYGDIKERGQYGTWLRTVAIKAQVHETFMILDPNYKPSTSEAKAIFEKATAFMFSVLNNNVKYNAGIIIIRKHIGNAQKIFDLLY
jgi:hypothetical protein